MDETEVQVEIACWAQDHPEASTINWDNGFEPWVSFSGKRCTLHLGLGGLTWSIKVPLGYQTEIDPCDGRRKRLWEPLDYHDTVIVQSRGTPFHVSVVDSSNNTLELPNALEPELVCRTGPGSIDEADQQQVHDMLRALQFTSDVPQNIAHGRKGLTISNAYFEFLNEAETLADVLDGIHVLAKLYNKHKIVSKPPPAATMGRAGPDAEVDAAEFVEDEDDDHMFGNDTHLKWSWIAAQVNYAHEACASVAAASEATKWKQIFVEFDSDSATMDMTSPLGKLTLQFPAGRQSAPSDSVDNTILFPKWSANISGQSKPQASDNVDVFRYNYDSDEKSDGGWEVTSFSAQKDKSDSSWEVTSFSGQKATSDVEMICDGEFGDWTRAESSSTSNSLQQMDYSIQAAVQSQPEDPLARKSMTECPEGLSFEESSWPPKELGWCDIAFNAQSFSVECTLRLSQFMDNQTIATALGFSLGHPLRVEISPNKSHVDSLAWTGAVEVYVSQQTDWHNHVSEDICGLLCLVPSVVQTYFTDHVPIFILNQATSGGNGPKGDLFMGVLQLLVRKLISVNAGNSCCVCGMPCERPTSYHMQEKSLWPCPDNLCQATYAAWREVSSVDPQERDREEKAQLKLLETTLRDDFPFEDLPALVSALEVYGVEASNWSYGQMIRTLARIELWNQRDSISESRIFGLGVGY